MEPFIWMCAGMAILLLAYYGHTRVVLPVAGKIKAAAKVRNAAKEQAAYEKRLDTIRPLLAPLTARVSATEDAIKVLKPDFKAVTA